MSSVSLDRIAANLKKLSLPRMSSLQSLSAALSSSLSSDIAPLTPALTATQSHDATPKKVQSKASSLMSAKIRNVTLCGRDGAVEPVITAPLANEVQC